MGQRVRRTIAGSPVKSRPEAARVIGGQPKTAGPAQQVKISSLAPSNGKAVDLSPEPPGTSSPPESETHSEDGDNNLLEDELSTSTHDEAHQVNNSPPSTSGVHGNKAPDSSSVGPVSGRVALTSPHKEQPHSEDSDNDLLEPLVKKRALLISIRHVSREAGSSFDNLANLEFAHRDAEELRDALIASHGYQADDIILMMDNKSYPEHLWPTRRRILHQIDQLINDAPENCHFFFYFSGHGLEVEADSDDRASMRADGREHEIVCADGKPIPDHILHDRLITPLERLKGSKIFALFDCCHSKLRSPSTYKTKEVGELDVICLSACRDGQLAYDDCELGLTFTKRFLNAIAKHSIAWTGLRDALKGVISQIRTRYEETYLQDPGESDGTHESQIQEPRHCAPLFGYHEVHADFTPELPATSSLPESETHSEGGDNNLLEVEVPTSTPAPLFDYDEPPSPAFSAHLCKDEAPPLDLSCAESQLSDPPLITTPPEAPRPKKPGASECISVLKRRLVIRFKKTNRNQGLQLPDQLFTQSGQPANLRPTSQSQTKVNTPNEGPSWMAAGQRRARAVCKPVTTKPVKQQGERGGGRVWVMVKVPAWMGRLLRLLKVGRIVPGGST